jgi:hypothetical protein
MPNKKINPKLLWIQFEDVLVPRLGLTVWDRAVYSYLLRHSLVIGKRRLHFAVMSVAHDLRVSNGPVRQAVRRLDELGALRLLERSKTGHLVEMRLPEHIRAIRESDGPPAALAAAPGTDKDRPSSTLEATDFMSTWRSARPFTIAIAAPDFTAFAALLPTSAALTMSSLARALDAIPTATWCPAASNAIPLKATRPPRIFCAFFTVKAGSPPPNWTAGSSP